MDFKDLEILRKGNNELRQKNENLKKELEKTCKQYLDLYAKVENARDMLKGFMMREKYKINNDKFTYIHLEQLGDFKMLLDELEVKNVN